MQLLQPLMQGNKKNVYFLACNCVCELYNNEEWRSKLRQLRLRKFFEFFFA